MEQKSDEETSENLPADSQSKQRSKKQKSSASRKAPAESQSESESNGEAEKCERDTETPSNLSDKRKLKAKEQKYATFTAVGASEKSVALSPTKRKCVERHVIASGNIKPGDKQVKADEPRTTVVDVVKQSSPQRSPTMPGTSAVDVVRQSSPQRSPTMPGTSAANIVMQGSPQRSRTMPGTSAANIVMQGSPQRSRTMPGVSAANIVMQGSPQRSPTMPGTSAASIVMQGSPQRSQTMPGTSAASIVMQGSPQRSPTMPGTSAASFVMQGSPQRSPTKRPYKEIYQSYSADELVEKRPKEECGYQSDTALDLRKEFKKQMPSSTQSPELDCQPSSSDKREDSRNRPEEKYATQSNFPRDPKSASSEVTSSDGGEADVSSTSNESVTSTSGKETSSAKGSQGQNIAEAKEQKTSPTTSPQHSGARPKGASGSRPVEFVEVSYPRFSPSRRFYGEPTIRRISPQRAGPSGSGSGGGFKVPPPPPPLEELDRPMVITNALETFHHIIVNVHALVTAEQAREQQRKEEEERARREKEAAENFARAKLQARETTKKLRAKEALLKEATESKSGEKKSDITPDEAVAGPSTSQYEAVAGPSTSQYEAVAGPSTSRDVTTGYGPEENINFETSMDKQATASGKEEHRITESISGKKQNLPVAHQGMHDENANIMEGGPSQSAFKDDSTKSEPCTVHTHREGTGDDARPSTSGVSPQRPQQSPRNREYLSLQQLVPQIDDISLDDSFENVAIADSEHEDDNVDLQNI